MSQPIAKLPWRKGGARGGTEEPLTTEYALMSVGGLISSAIFRSPRYIEFARNSILSWDKIDWWMPMSEASATLPAETAKETT